jgi:hypothetical protein
LNTGEWLNMDEFIPVSRLGYRAHEVMRQRGLCQL